MKHFANLNLRSVLLVLFSLLLFSISEKTYSQTLIAGWDFQTSPGTAVLASPNTPKLYSANVGSGTLYLDGTNNSSSWVTAELNAFGGTALNAGASTGLSTTTTSPASLAILGGAATPTANGKSIIFKVNMTGYQNLVISYATQKTSTGFNTQVWEYSTNGTSWSSIGTISTIPSSFATQTLSTVTGLNSAVNAYVRLTVTGATNTSGNNRLDNIQFNATLIPVPTLTSSSTSLTNLSYVESNGPSAEQSYTLSGSVLNPASDTIKIFAPSNFEISKTSGSGFKDSLNVLYSGSAFASTTIYTRLKTGLTENTYSGNITHSGGGVASPPSVALSGSVTTVPPPVVTTTGTLTTFSTFVGNPVTPQSYTVSGTNLVSDITITAPAGFEIKTGANAYASSLILPQSSGSVATTTIDVRLINTTAGTFSGNITHTTTNLTPSPTVAVSGTVTVACTTPTNISVVRASIPEQGTFPATGVTATPATVAGRVTAIFGTNKFYVQDTTGGLAIFSTASGGVVAANGIALGDSVKVTGGMARFNGEAEFNSATCVNKITGNGAITTPPAIIFDANNPPTGINLPTFLADNEGKLVKIISTNINVTGTFASNTNYSITACNSQGEAEIRVDATATTIPTQNIPTVTQDITGVIGHYINASATVNILQLFPRTIADLGNSAITCVTPVPSPSASCGAIASTAVPVDSTLDITTWNVEWLGNTTTSPSALGPTNDTQQMTNVITVLNTLKSDIFCVEEVCDHKQFIARVGTDLPEYGVVCQTKYYSHFFDSPETNSATSFGQKVCFLYKKSIVSYVDTLSLLASQYGYNATPVATPYPNNWASGRLPYMFVADITLNGLTKRINFVGLHAKSGSDAASYNRRKQDVIDLKAELDTNYPSANIMMLGDYNDDLDGSIYVGQTSTYGNFVSDNTNYVQVSKALSDCAVSSTASYADIIDHIMVSNEFGVIPATGSNPAPSTSGIYYLEKTVNVSRPINYVAGYTSTTSDHYPVNARFRFGLPPVAPATITSVSTGNWSSPSTWDCNCVPTAASDVIVDTAHTVTVDVASQAKTLNLKGTLNWAATFTLSLGM
ncbi:endonuclease/exonuclease/phosphatase family protein [Arcicella sp. LKC2W]|uniref:endonuclease/exonuclease/phosphatase family protein n=1 Tax=Arcicella sp. LKC2W TaxID=2984198 RepID=UPI002B216CE8|nr:endonuclease/exonuclease/phosphatase family protein [Arcicella sp. LKC2W]MEA5461236.1 endonuclease/exonuclease/phosphatase family protein [Arcicella sp. LKC2W]